MGGAAIVVAIAADRLLLIAVVIVAIRAIKRRVNIIQHEAGHSVTKSLLVPVGMAVDAHATQSANPSSCGVTRPAVELFVIPA